MHSRPGSAWLEAPEDAPVDEEEPPTASRPTSAGSLPGAVEGEEDPPQEDEEKGGEDEEKEESNDAAPEEDDEYE